MSARWKNEWECVYPGKPYRYWQLRDITVSWDGDDVAVEFDDVRRGVYGDDVAVEFDDVRRGVYIPPHVLRDSLPPEPLSLHDAMFECRGVGDDWLGAPCRAWCEHYQSWYDYGEGVFDLDTSSESATLRDECTAADATGAA